MSLDAYKIVKRDSAEDCRRTVRYDRDYQYALIGPPDADGRRYVVSCSMGPGGTLKRLMEIANDAYELGFRAGLQFNGEFE